MIIRVPTFEAEAIVVWCNKIETNEEYEIGVRFLDESTDFKLRMVEQVCQIEQHKNNVLSKEHRQLSNEEAAVEWIEKHAHNFPQ